MTQTVSLTPTVDLVGTEQDTICGTNAIDCGFVSELTFANGDPLPAYLSISNHVVTFDPSQAVAADAGTHLFTVKWYDPVNSVY